MFAMTSPQTYHHQPRLRARVGALLHKHTTHVAIFTCPQAWKAVNPQLENSLRDAGIRWQTNFLTTECTDAAVMTHLNSVRRQNATRVLPDIGNSRAQSLAAIAREVKFPACEALRLPFSVAAENVEHALLTLETATF